MLGLFYLCFGCSRSSIGVTLWPTFSLWSIYIWYRLITLSVSDFIACFVFSHCLEVAVLVYQRETYCYGNVAFFFFLSFSPFPRLIYMLKLLSLITGFLFFNYVFNWIRFMSGILCDCGRNCSLKRKNRLIREGYVSFLPLINLFLWFFFFWLGRFLFSYSLVCHLGRWENLMDYSFGYL